ncbi:unnamed protein product [Choristocarpus tenellus]
MKVTLACMLGMVASTEAFTGGFFGARTTRTALQPARATARAQQPSMLFGGGAPKEEKAGGDKKGEGFNMGNMMEGLKKANEIGQKTKDLQKDLEGLRVEGLSEDGKVKVTMTGQQHPVGCEINPELMSEGAEAVSEKVTQAMQRAHAESLALMSQKLAQLYSEMGLPMGQ